MKNQFVAVLLVSLAALLPAAVLHGQTGAGPKQPDRAPLPDASIWVLKRLDEDPVKLIKVSFDPEKGQVRFVLEFTRSLKPSDSLEWDRVGAPFLFRFMDEDDVVLRTVQARFDGDVVPSRGRRFRIVLQVPNRETLVQTRRILVD